MTRRLSTEERRRLGLTAAEVKALRLSDEQLAEMLRPSPPQPSPAEIAARVARMTREGPLTTDREWQWTDPTRPERVMSIREAVAWAARKASTVDQASEERAALVALIHAAEGGAHGLNRLSDGQELVDRYLDGEATKPELRSFAVKPEKPRGGAARPKKGTPLLDALDYRPGQVIEYETLENLARSSGRQNADSVKQTIRAEIKSLRLPRPEFGRKRRRKPRK